MPLVCAEDKALSYQRVQELFLLANEEECTISVPPAHLKGGDAYLYVPESPNTVGEFYIAIIYTMPLHTIFLFPVHRPHLITTSSKIFIIL